MAFETVVNHCVDHDEYENICEHIFVCIGSDIQSSNSQLNGHFDGFTYVALKMFIHSINIQSWVKKKKS